MANLWRRGWFGDYDKWQHMCSLYQQSALRSAFGFLHILWMWIFGCLVVVSSVERSEEERVLFLFYIMQIFLCIKNAHKVHPFHLFTYMKTKFYICVYATVIWNINRNIINYKVANSNFSKGARGPHPKGNFGKVGLNATSPKFPMRWGPPAPFQKLLLY